MAWALHNNVLCYGPVVVRSRCLLFAAFLLLCSLAGCLLYTDGFNVPPEVVLNAPEQMLRNRQGVFSAVVRDADERSENLKLAWYLRDGAGCPKSTAEALAMQSDSKAMQVGTQPTQPVIRQEFGPFCILVVVTDAARASAWAAEALDVTNQTPSASLELLAPRPVRWIGPEAQLPLYSQVRVSAAKSEDPEAETLEFRWSITGRNGEAIAPIPCDGTGMTKEICHRLDATGSYRFALRTWDGAQESVSVELPMAVLPDAAPCIEQTEPPYQLPRVVFLSTDRTNIRVVEVTDDGDPFPGAPGQQPQLAFIWRFRPAGAADFQRIRPSRPR